MYTNYQTAAIVMTLSDLHAHLPIGIAFVDTIFHTGVQHLTEL